MYQALYRKWRPQRFEDVVGQSHITQTLRTQVETGRLSHAYLFTGTRGTGKTTCAKILAKAVNCEHPVHGDPCNECAACRGIDDGSILDVVELDAASNNGVDQVRALRDEAVYSPAAVKKRVYIVDEVHMLTTAAFNALLKILEEPPEHLMFILATTELHKVPATILSRCQRFSFQRITAPDIQGRLSYVAREEGIQLTDDGAALLARLADGALRDGLSLLDQCAAVGGVVDREAVLDALGLAGNLRTAHLMNHIRRGNTAQALTELGDLYAAGKGVPAVLSELSALVRDLLIQKTAPKGGAGLMNGGYDEETLNTLGRGMSPQRLIQMLRLLQDTQAGLRTSANQRTDAELCLIRLCDETLDTSNEGLSARVARLEAALAGGIAPQTAPTERETEAPPPPVQPAAPTPEPDDLPPWETEPTPPPEQVRQAPPPIKRAPPARFAPAKGPAPRQGGDDGFWSGLLPLLRTRLKPWVYMPLTDSSAVSARLENDTLAVYAADQFAYQTVNKPDLLRTIGEAASQKAGRSIQAVAKRGTPPAQTDSPVKPASGGTKTDPFQDLLRTGENVGAEID
ncbi:MAG: DNA polymerase III subunit gamma/tau [Clostridiales bacterium]|nr:DNA polymerase III subunit gamma/tau [Clostridiales bacterium]